MATIEELCEQIEACCGTPSDALFKRVVVKAMCALAAASYDTESEAFACAYDGDQNPAGWVFLTTVDAVGDDDPAAEVGHSLKLVQLDGSVIMDYDPAAEGHVLGKCVTGCPLLWTQCMEDDNGKFTRAFIKDPVADTTRFQDHVYNSGEDYTPVGEIFPCEIDIAAEKCMKSKQAGEFTSDFLAIDDAVPGSSDPVTATIDGPMDGIFATIEMQNGTTWGSGTSGGQTITGVRIPDKLGSATVNFDFPDACEGVIDVTRTRLMFWDLDGDGGNVNQEFVEFETPFARVSDNLLIMNAPTNTIVGGFPGADAEHNWVEWDGLVDSIHLKRDPEIGGPPRGNILLEGIEVSATVIALYTGVQEPDGSWKYFDYQGNELTDPVLLARLRPCNETICSEAEAAATLFPESDEVVTLCDDNGSFLRRITNDGEGDVTVTDTELDGITLYAPVGVVTVCTADAVEQELPESDEVTILCDDNGSFFRRITNDGEGGIAVTDTALDGVTAYTPVGTVVVCAAETVELPESDEVVVLCDDNGSFLRRVTNDGEGTISVSDTTLDGITAYTPVGTVERCAGETIVSWEQCLQDDNGIFKRVFLKNLETDVVTTQDHDSITGADYVSVGTVSVCADEEVEQELPESDEVVVLCDDNGSFLRRVTNDGEGGITVTDTALDGTTAYTTSGAVTNCSVSSSDVEQEILCAEGERFVRHTEYQNGAVVNTFDTAMDMTTPIVVTEAAVERCQPRDVEVVVMCEADGTRFLRHITRDLYDNQVSVRDTDVDGVTSYTATGNEEPCGCQEVDWVKELCDVIITPITIPALFANGETVSNRQVTFTDGDYTISARAQESISLTTLGIFVGILGDRISLSGIPASATNIEMGIERWQVSEGEALAAFTENVTVVSGGYTSSGTTITATADGINAGVVGLPDGTTDFSFEIFRTNEVGSGAITSISFDIPLPTKFQRRFTIACDGSLTTKDYTCDGADYVVEGEVGCCDIEGNSCENPLFTKSSESWTEKLCDIETEIVALDVYTIDTDTDEVSKYDGISNTVIDSFTPPGAVNYSPASAYDAGSDTYYTYDLNAGEWHSYVGSNIGAGYTNLGSFAGPSITALNFGAIDPTTGLGHFGSSNTSRYVVDFQAATVTALPLASVPLNSLAINEDGIAYVGSDNPAGAIGTIDLVTGVATLPNSIAPAVANGLSVDNTGNNLGFFASDANGSQLYRWTEPDASDSSLVGTFPPSGTLDIGQAELNITKTEFIRHYEKECSGNVVYTDYDNEGQTYTSSGDVQVCTVTEDAVSAATVAGTLTSVATAGAQATPAGAQEVSIANVGTADALVAGATLPAGATVTYTGYFDNAANTYNRLSAITYDAQTSTLLVSVTP